MAGAEKTTMKVLIGPEDNSGNIIMRYFKVSPSVQTPWHRHGFEHLVKIEKREGVIINATKEKIRAASGQSAFIASGEFHQFKNPFPDDFEFICVIPNPDKG